MEPDALSPGSSPYYDFVYNNESVVEPVYWPLVFSQMQTKRAANELYTDDPSQYITYSGSWQSLLVAREKEGRYKNFSIRAYSGDSFNFYISIPSGESSTYYSGPLTTSGNYSVLTEYTVELDAQQSPVTFQAPTDNAQVYTLPAVKAVDWVRLHHASVVSGQAYRIYQFLPRTLIQVDDLEADVIDAVTIRVSDSIVISADDLAPGSITGEKILAGTISGVLITPGTITANEINVAQLDALAANMGTLIVNSGLTLGEAGYLWTGPNVSGEYILNKTGVEIRNSFGAANVIYAVGGGSSVAVTYAQTAKLAKYKPALFTTPVLVSGQPSYTLTTYSGSAEYLDMAATQIGQFNQSQSTFNGYVADISAGYSPNDVTDLRNDYTKLTISAVASGYSELYLYSTGDFTGSSGKGSSIRLNAGSLNLSSLEKISVKSPVIRLLETLAVSKDVSQPFPYVEAYSDILNVSASGLVVNKPSDAYAPDNSQELLRVTPTGNVSIYNNLTVSGNIVGRGSSISYLDNSDGSTIFSVSSTGIVLNSSAGDKIIDISTSTGNLDLLGGDFFVYNSAESAIVAGIDKTGVLQVSDGSVSAPTLSFRNDTDTGFYKAEDNVIRISTGSNFTGLFSTNQIQMASGTEALPSYTFVNDNDSGMYRRGANQIAFVTSATDAMIIGAAGTISMNTTNSNGHLTIEVPNGTARNVMAWRQLNDASAYVNFVSNTVTTSTPIQTSALGAYAGKVRVQINGTVRWIPFYQ